MLAEKTVKKHVAIIHAYSLMTILQRKIVNGLFYEALNSNHEFIHSHSTHTEFRIPLSKIIKTINYKSNNSKYLKEAIDALASLKIEWNLLKDKAPNDISFLNLRIMHGSPTFYQDNTFAFSFHKVFMSLMSQPSIYGTLDIDLQSRFESKYSHALYENCTRFVNMKKGKIIEMETFRKLLGVPKGKYTSTGELMRNAIQPAVEEVNDRADFCIDLRNINIGRKIVGFNIDVNSKNKTIKTQKHNYTFEYAQIITEIKNAFGEINLTALSHILKIHDVNYIQEKIAYTKNHAKQEKSGFYPIAYFISALKYDYKEKITENQQLTSEVSLNQHSNTIWETELKNLQLDLNHWKDLLNHFKQSNNDKQIKNINTIIAQCEDKLQLHLNQAEFKEKIVK